jgi:hypothetical protein
LFSLPAHVVAILVKNQVGHLPIRLSEKLQLSIHDFQEELALRFGKDREFALIWTIRTPSRCFPIAEDPGGDPAGVPDDEQPNIAAGNTACVSQFSRGETNRPCLNLLAGGAGRHRRYQRSVLHLHASSRAIERYPE